MPEVKEKKVYDVVYKLLIAICKKKFFLKKITGSLYLYYDGNKREIDLSKAAKKIASALVNNFFLGKKSKAE
jgi:hypothetical protein